MPISFHCETCRRSICVPDGSEGKKTRCSYCASIVRVPFSGSPKLLTVQDVPEVAPLEDDDPLGIVGKTESRWDQPAPQQSSPNPFADQPDPVPVEMPTTPQPVQTGNTIGKQKSLKILATILLVLGVPGLIAGLLTVSKQVILYIDHPTGDPPTIASLALMVVFFTMQMITMVGLNEARVMRNYLTARAGMIMAIIPIFYPAACLVVPLGLTIWGVAILYDPVIRDSFKSEQGYTPD